MEKRFLDNFMRQAQQCHGEVEQLLVYFRLKKRKLPTLLAKRSDMHEQQTIEGTRRSVRPTILNQSRQCSFWRGRDLGEGCCPR